MKPPYVRPSMDDVAEVESNGLTVASTFTGAGGTCLGYRLAGFWTVYANEFVAAARETYAANFPGVALDDRDVREVTGDSIRDFADVDEVDVLEGSPPCASFSMAGKRQHGWGEEKTYSDTVQRADDLVFEWVRLVGELSPRVAVMENVAGLARGVAKGYLVEIVAGLRALGYVVQARLLDAQWLGVPQARERVFVVGVREDLGLAPSFPSPLPYRYSIRDALPHLAGVSTETGVVSDAPVPTILTHGNRLTRSERTAIVGRTGPGFSSRREPLDEPIGSVWASGDDRDQYVVEDGPRLTLDDSAVGREWDKLAPGGQSERYYQLVRPDPDEPVPTVTAMGGVIARAAVTHPIERRKFTIDELKALCGFPADFVLTGSYAQQWERLGRAVPPPMAYAVASSVRDLLLGASR